VTYIQTCLDNISPGYIHIMYLSEGIINNFVESLDEAEITQIESLNDQDAYKFIAHLYEKSYGAEPSGAGIYLIRKKFKIGCEETNRKFIPNALI